MMVGLFKLLVFIMEFHYDCIGSEELLHAIIPKGAIHMSRKSARSIPEATEIIVMAAVVYSKAILAFYAIP